MDIATYMIYRIISIPFLIFCFWIGLRAGDWFFNKRGNK